jgi:hypothetical protein
MLPNTKRHWQLFFRWLGLAFLGIPIFFQWYITDANRYVTMIRGPYPFSHLGGITYQIVGTMIMPLMFAISAWCLAASFSLPRSFGWASAPYHPGVMRGFALAFAIIGLLFGAVIFLPALFS